MGKSIIKLDVSLTVSSSLSEASNITELILKFAFYLFVFYELLTYLF